MITLVILSIITLALLLYAIVIRDWMKSKPWAQGFFSVVEPIEIILFKKSETILAARTLQFLGGTLTFLTWIGSIDITPILPLVPDKYVEVVKAFFSCLPLALNLLGAMFERLRNTTTKPVDLVALPDKVVAENPRIAEAVAMAETTKAEAVSVIAQVKEA